MKRIVITKYEALKLEQSGCNFKAASLYQLNNELQEIVLCDWIHNLPMISSWTFNNIYQCLVKD